MAKKQSNLTPCSSCGRTDVNVTTFANAETMESSYICGICASTNSKDTSKNGTSENLATRIKEEMKNYRELEERLEALILYAPKKAEELENSEAARDFGNLAFTPISMMRGIKQMIAHLEMQRILALIAEGGEAYLKDELEQALQDEDFEKAAKVRTLLDGLPKK